MTDDRFTRLRTIQARAYDRAPAIRTIFDATGLRPEQLHNTADLARLPVFKKEAMIEQQRLIPPYGGFLAADPGDIERVFVSPGPINEPQLRSEDDAFGFGAAFAAAGIGKGDMVLNTWSYHLVPAGLLLDEGLRSTGAAVIPAGTGGSEMQAKLVRDLGVTCICAATAYFVTLAETLEQTGHELPRDWRVTSAFLGGEFGDWMGKRRRLEARYGIRTFSVYATADFGLIGFERTGVEGYEIHPDRIVQICDPLNGQPLPLGEPGEIVVSTLRPGWPLIRFGTGDVAIARELHADGSVARISMLQGRVGQSVKAREIFIYPRQLEDLVIAVPGIQRAQASISREGHRDCVTLRLALQDGIDAADVTEPAQMKFRELSRLKADHVEIVGATELTPEAPLVRDLRQ
ncbi:phenylacetate--CoA ligase family protein [Ferrovibrio sp.]|uniref:phenylacetate--CoA ligase family protein n=1 Tax=Ferrovibrio sp. TaxID=1917215 RepID=UPI003D0DC56E